MGTMTLEQCMSDVMGEGRVRRWKEGARDEQCDALYETLVGLLRAHRRG